jgi:hypothetical protein
LPIVVSIAAEAAAGSATLAPVVSAVLTNPIAVEEIAKFGFGIVLSIAAAGSIKNYLEQISTPEGALQVALELFVLHATVKSSSGGPSRPVTIRGEVEEATPNGISVRITDLPDLGEHPIVQGGRAANTNISEPDNVHSLQRPQAVAQPGKVAVGQSYTGGPPALETDTDRPVAATRRTGPSSQVGPGPDQPSSDASFGTPVPKLKNAYRAPPPITGNPQADRFEQSQRTGRNSVYVLTGERTKTGKPEHVEFDDFRSGDNMLIDAKARLGGAGSIYDVREPTSKVDEVPFRQRLVLDKVMKQENARQIAGAKGVVWVVQDKGVAQGLREFFAKKGFTTFRVEDPK